MKDILAKSLLNKIERLEAFEERLGVRFENISVIVESNDRFRLFFELYSNSGTSLDENSLLAISGSTFRSMTKKSLRKKQT